MTLPLYVVKNGNKNLQGLIGQSWLEKLQINWSVVCSVTVQDKVAALREKFPEPFRDTPGIVKDYEAQLVIKEHCQPVFLQS